MRTRGVSNRDVYVGNISAPDAYVPAAQTPGRVPDPTFEPLVMGEKVSLENGQLGTAGELLDSYSGG